jgi:hypothetical protein
MIAGGPIPRQPIKRIGSELGNVFHSRSLQRDRTGFGPNTETIHKPGLIRRIGTGPGRTQSKKDRALMLRRAIIFIGFLLLCLAPASAGLLVNSGNQIAIDSLRTDLINKIWTGHGRPTNGVDSIAIIANPMPVIPANLLRVEHWTFEMYDYSGNFVDTSVDTVFWPKVGNGKLVLLAAGHGVEYGIWNKAHGYTDTASDLINAGYTVVTLFMPFAGDVTEHNALPQPTSTINYLKFFVDPATRALNQTANQFSAAYMVGKSGGGWLTHLLAAIDTRIAKSVGIAGSMPLFISGNWPGKRDFEQFLPGLGVDYPDLYIIAADTGREQMQILNHDDPCCFTGSFYESLSHPYGPDIATATSNRWSIYIDNVNDHTISANARRLILNFFGHPNTHKPSG